MKTLEVTSHAGISLKNILFATDFSEASQAALPYAAAIARRYDSQLHIAHIMSPASYHNSFPAWRSSHYRLHPRGCARGRPSTDGDCWRHI